MESVRSPQSPEAKKTARSGSKQPLYIRLYFRRHMTELVQLLGYRDVPLDDIKPQLASMAEQYGQETIDAATEEIIEIVTVTQTFARLKAEVRHVARQILGRPPDPAGAAMPDVRKTILPVPSPSPAIANDRPKESTPSPPRNAPSQEELPTSTEDESYLAAYEVHEGQLYCCDQPKLKWFGEIDDLSVACESCGYVLFARDELMPDGEPPGIILDADESRLAVR
jgi:hypothetical protein